MADQMKNKMPEGWKETTLGKQVRIGRGSSPRPIHDFISAYGIPWVKIADASASETRYILKTKEFIKEEGRSTSVKIGDLIVSNSATPGIPKFMGIDACVHDGWLVFSDYKDLDKEYLYYFFLDYRRALEHSASGTVFDNLKTEIVRNIEINLPPLPEQHAIAKALGSLDNKIELLRRQNKTLENIAQAIFKHWFTDFEFPDKNGKLYKSSGGKMIDSEFGEIPEGWHVGTLGEEFQIIMGQSPEGESYNEVGNGMIFFQGRTDFQDRFPQVRLYTTNPKRIAQKLDVLVSVRAPVGDINVAYDKCCIGRGLGAVRSNYKSYALHKIKSLKRSFCKFEAEGTVFGSINKDDFANIATIVPIDEIVSLFETTVGPIDQKYYTNYNQIQTLSKIRDAVLPKLMKGELRVELKDLVFSL